jgi:endonuclease/exonuclease/phosphatase (EEP) superfamily protein YafD
MLFVEIKTDAGRFEVINIHVPREEREQRTPRRLKPFIEYIRKSVEIREAKFDELLTLLPENQPVILAGDMNTPPASRYHAAVAERLTDSFQAVGSGFGHTFVWQQQWPLLRIDYVWSGGGITPVRHQIRPHEPSDHRPVIVDIALPRQ